ncbi:MAG TPA: hypothetical protein VGN17_20925 [Bryobacteraceae bacterium]|jgi:hypothetical protein
MDLREESSETLREKEPREDTLGLLRAKLAPIVFDRHDHISGLIAKYGVKPAVLEELHPDEVETIGKLVSIWRQHAPHSKIAGSQIAGSQLAGSRG